MHSRKHYVMPCGLRSRLCHSFLVIISRVIGYWYRFDRLDYLSVRLSVGRSVRWIVENG